MTRMRSNDKEARWKERGRVTCAQRLVQLGTRRIKCVYHPAYVLQPGFVIIGHCGRICESEFVYDATVGVFYESRLRLSFQSLKRTIRIPEGEGGSGRT